MVQYQDANFTQFTMRSFRQHLPPNGPMFGFGQWADPLVCIGITDQLIIVAGDSFLIDDLVSVSVDRSISDKGKKLEAWVLLAVGLVGLILAGASALIREHERGLSIMGAGLCGIVIWISTSRLVNPKEYTLWLIETWTAHDLVTSGNMDSLKGAAHAIQAAIDARHVDRANP